MNAGGLPGRGPDAMHYADKKAECKAISEVRIWCIQKYIWRIRKNIGDCA
jgi:hypothetical protein